MNDISFEKIHKKYYILCYFGSDGEFRYSGPSSDPNSLLKNDDPYFNFDKIDFYWIQEVKLIGRLRDDIRNGISIEDIELETNDHFEQKK